MRCSTKTQNSLPEKPHEMIPLFLDDKEWFSKLAGSKWDINSLIPYKWFHNNPESNGISSLTEIIKNLLKLLVKDFCELSPFVDGLYLYSKRPERFGKSLLTHTATNTQSYNFSNLPQPKKVLFACSGRKSLSGFTPLS
uniref:Uncharacterized protein n=1 Tax=Glossina austeni TaxID=7395 RepID=A0A1A9UZ83_GLOAU